MIAKHKITGYEMKVWVNGKTSLHDFDVEFTTYEVDLATGKVTLSQLIRKNEVASYELEIGDAVVKKGTGHYEVVKAEEFNKLFEVTK